MKPKIFRIVKKPCRVNGVYFLTTNSNYIQWKRETLSGLKMKAEQQVC